MILEVAVLNVLPGREVEFESAFKQAQAIISSMRGYRSHERHRCIATATRYILLARWDKLDDHMVGFRGSPGYQEWKWLLYHFYDRFPMVEHFTARCPACRERRQPVGRKKTTRREAPANRQGEDIWNT